MERRLTISGMAGFTGGNFIKRQSTLNQMATVKCNKCNGKGHIPGFSHVNQGRCFDCNGAGILPEPKKSTVKYSVSFCLQFYKRGSFEKDHTVMQKIACIAFQGHPTAEEWILADKDFYYIWQPVCRTYSWYEVPKGTFEEFLTNYDKAFRRRGSPVTPIFNSIINP